MTTNTSINGNDDMANVFQLSWNFISILLTVIGNTFVLVASCRDKAIKLDRVSIVFLENLAVANIGIAVFCISPSIGLILKYNSANDVYQASMLHRIIELPGLLFLGISAWLLPWLNCCKLLCLVFPLRVRNYRYRHGYLITSAIWITQTCMVLSFKFAFSSEKQKFMFQLIGLSLLILIIFASTSALLLTVHKARGLTRQGVFSIILVSVVYLVCYLPLLISQITAVFGVNYPIVVEIFGNVLYLTCFSNIAVYYLTLHSFKDYVDLTFQNCQINFRRIFSIFSNAENAV